MTACVGPLPGPTDAAVLLALETAL